MEFYQKINLLITFYGQNSSMLIIKDYNCNVFTTKKLYQSDEIINLLRLDGLTKDKIGSVLRNNVLYSSKLNCIRKVYPP